MRLSKIRLIRIKELNNQIRNSKLAKDSFWAISGNVIAKGLSMIAMIIIARILGKDSFGEYGMVSSTLTTLAILSTFGLGYTATKYIAEYKEAKPEYINHIIRVTQRFAFLIAFVLCLFVLFFSSIIATEIFEEPTLSFSLRLSVVFILFNSVVITQIGILAGFGDFKTLAKINSITGVSSITTSVLLTYFFSVNGALIGLVIIQFLNFALNWRVIQKKKNLFPQGNSSLLKKEVLRFSAPVGVQEMAWSILSWLSGLILVKFSSYSEMGLYSAAMQWSAIILFIPGILRNVILSHMASNLNNEEKHNGILKSILLLNFLVTFTLSITVFMFSDFIGSFYGKNFEGFEEVVTISVFSTIFTSLSNVYAQAYMSKGQNWLMLLFRVIRDGTILFMAYFLITSSNGANGAMKMAVSLLTANVLFLGIMAVFYETKLKHGKTTTI